MGKNTAFNNEIPTKLRGAMGFAGYIDLWSRAKAAGVAAGEAAVPVPMTVGTAKGFGDEIDETQPVYHVPEGACGFAWVNVKPGTSRFAKWLKRGTRPSTGTPMVVTIAVDFDTLPERVRNALVTLWAQGFEMPTAWDVQLPTIPADKIVSVGA